MRNSGRRVFLFLWMLVSGVAQAQTGVVVIPLMGGDSNNLKNIITVALKYGDFTDPLSALSSIPTAGPAQPSVTNRYLIVIGPGEYDLGSEQIVMRQWVSIQGSGRETTLLSGEVSAGLPDQTSALVVGADNVALTDLTIENRGGDSYSTAIYSYGHSPRIARVDARSWGGSVINCGMQNEEAASPTITDASFSAQGGITAVGLALHKTISNMTNVTAVGTGGTVSNQGVTMSYSSPRMTNIEVRATGSGLNYGLYASYSSPTITNLHAWGGDKGQRGYGAYVDFSSSPLIQGSVLTGQTSALFLDTTATRSQVVNSKLVNGVEDEPTSQQCRDTYSATLASEPC